MLRIDYQIIRYGITGILLNLLTYSFYLGLTWLWLTPRQAITLLYPIGILLSYLSHRTFTFRDRKNTSVTAPRYLSIHVLSYFLNITIIYIFVDLANIPHQFAQVLAVFIIAAFSYFSMKKFVFRHRKA